MESCADQLGYDQNAVLEGLTFEAHKRQGLVTTVRRDNRLATHTARVNGKIYVGLSFGGTFFRYVETTEEQKKIVLDRLYEDLSQHK